MRRAGDPTVPALVSEADLFLRLCPAPTIGVTGTKGKTTTASLTAALLAADPAHPVVLGGNIGIPIVERLPELTPGPPRRRRAVGAPAADAVARHDRGGLHQRHVGPPRPARVARGLPAGQAPAGRAGRPGRRARPQRRGPGRRRRMPASAGRGRSATGATGPSPAAARASSTAGSWPTASSGSALAGGGVAATGPDGRIMPVAELAIPGAHNVSNALAAIGVALAFGVAPDAIRAAAAAAFTGVEHRLEPVARHRRRPVHQRLAGDAARRGRSRPCAPSSRRSSSSPAAATRASTSPRSRRSSPSAPSRPS